MLWPGVRTAKERLCSLPDPRSPGTHVVGPWVIEGLGFRVSYSTHMSCSLSSLKGVI